MNARLKVSAILASALILSATAAVSASAANIYTNTWHNNELAEQSCSRSVDFRIIEVRRDRFVCTTASSYSETYNIICNTYNYLNLCTDDIITVEFDNMYQTDSYEYNINPISICRKGSQSVYTENSSVSSLNFKIKKIRKDMFICSMTFPYPAEYRVMCNTDDFGQYRVGDIITVEYKEMEETDTFEYEIEPLTITSGTNSYHFGY